MFEVDFDAISEEERRQKGLKKKSKKEKSPFGEVSNDENPFGRRGRGKYQEVEVEDAPIENNYSPKGPSYIPKDRLEEDSFKSVQIDTSDYPEVDRKKEVYDATRASVKASKLLIAVLCIAVVLGAMSAILVRYVLSKSFTSSTHNTTHTEETQSNGKGGTSFRPTLDYYELNEHDSTINLANGDSVYAGDRMHFRVVLNVKNPNPDEWDYIVSIRVNGAKLVEDESYMTNATLKNFNKTYQNALFHNNDVDYYKKFTISANTTKTVIIEFSFDVKDNKDKLTIEIGSDMFSPDTATSLANVMKATFPII